MEEQERKNAEKRALDLLTGRDYTRKELLEKLIRSGYSEEAANGALSYVEAFHYVDDRRYAAAYLRTYAQRKTEKRMREELLRKGIDREILEQTFLSFAEENEGENAGERELSMAVRLLEKRHYQPDTADRKEKQKQYGFLMRKGFRSEVVCRALQMAEEE